MTDALTLAATFASVLALAYGVSWVVKGLGPETVR